MRAWRRGVWAASRWSWAQRVLRTWRRSSSRVGSEATASMRSPDLRGQGANQDSGFPLLPIYRLDVVGDAQETGFARANEVGRLPLVQLAKGLVEGDAHGGGQVEAAHPGRGHGDVQGPLGVALEEPVRQAVRLAPE